MIVVDASAMPDFPSGARTRLRGLYGAYAQRRSGPAVRLLLARGSSLMDGLDLPARSQVRIEPVTRPGGPLRRALRSPFPRRLPGAPPKLWHSETIPPLGSARAPRLLTLHDLRWLEGRDEAGGSAVGHAMRRLASRHWLPRVLRALDGVIAVSADTRARIHARLGVPHRRIHLVPNAVGHEARPMEAAAAQETVRKLGVGEPFLLSLGHLEPRKGLDLVLSALARAEPGNPSAQVHYALAGEGPDRPRLERMASDLGLGPRVHFLGRCSDQTVRALLERCMALAFPSHLEGFGFPVFEALNRGCPVLSTPLPCLDEIRDAGLIRGERDAPLWANKIQWIFHHRDELRRRPEQSASWRIEATWERSADTLAKVYEQVLREG